MRSDHAIGPAKDAKIRAYHSRYLNALQGEIVPQRLTAEEAFNALRAEVAFVLVRGGVAGDHNDPVVDQCLREVGDEASFVQGLYDRIDGLIRA